MRLRGMHQKEGVAVNEFDVKIVMQSQISWVNPPATPREEYRRKMVGIRLQRSLEVVESIIQSRVDNLFLRALPVTQAEFDQSLEDLFK